MTAPDLQAVFLDLATVDCGDIELTPLEQAISSWRYHDNTKPEETLARIQDANIVVTNKVVLDQGVIQQAANLQLICIAATGVNNVDLKAAAAHGVAVTNVAGYSTPSVVQQVFAMILALTSRLSTQHELVSSGNWQQSDQFCLLNHPFREVSGKRIGIIGYGTLGQAVAKVAEAFDMEVVIAQRPNIPPSPGRLPLDAVLETADIVTLHCPLTEETRSLIGKRELSMMKPEAILINTARGGIVDEAALARALIDGKLAGAGVDVISNEPPTNGNPLLDPAIPNLIVTPHIAWASRESRQRLVNEVGANIQAFHANKQRNRVA